MVVRVHHLSPCINGRKGDRVSAEWIWSDAADSWVMGNPGDGAGVFFENGEHPSRTERGWYFSLVVDNYLREISTGPFPDRESAMKAAEDRFRQEKEKT